MNALDEMLEELSKDQPVKGTACGCKEAAIHDVTITQRVAVGEDEYIEVDVPAVNCEACNVRYVDHRAEELIRDAVCRHRQLLTPSEVKAVRLALGMTRTDFAEAYGVAPASMERWENGRLTQSASANTLLVALGNVALAHRLDRRKKTTSTQTDGNVIHAAFGDLCSKPDHEQEEILKRQRDFSLRLTA